MGLAVALARAGVRVTLIEEDDHDARRVGDILAKAGAGAGITITTDPAIARRADLLVAAPASGTAGLVPVLRDAAPDALLVLMGQAPLPDDLPPRIAARLVRIDSAAPPPAIALIEIVAPAADATTQVRADALAMLLGASAVHTPVFIAAPLLARMEDIAEDLIFRGATPWQVDEALEAFGFSLGPCAAQDLRGLDLAYARHRREDTSGTRRVPCPVLDRMVPEGRLGHKGGVGWYRYPGGGGRVIDPLIEDLAREEAYFAGITPRPLSDDTLRHRTVLALIDAGAELLAAGVPARVIDRVSIAALGFPLAHGGLMTFAEKLGLARVLADLKTLALEDSRFAPSDALLSIGDPA